MQNSQRKPRSLKQHEYDARWKALEKRSETLDCQHTAQVEELRGDTARFFGEVFGFKPFWYQLELADLFDKNQFLAVRWPRQTGKSFTVSALLLIYAFEHPDSYIAIVGPSWRQTKLHISRLSGF